MTVSVHRTTKPANAKSQSVVLKNWTKIRPTKIGDSFTTTVTQVVISGVSLVSLLPLLLLLLFII